MTPRYQKEIIMTNEHTDKHENQGHHEQQDPPINIQIDRVHYKVYKHSMTGAEIRHVPATPIPADRDLFLVVPGGTDLKIGDDVAVELHDGSRFFTAPGQINPGRASAL
jgi:hypothetical protein